MPDFVFEPPLRLAHDVTLRTLDDAAEFARTYVSPRLPYWRDRVVRRLEEISGEASARGAARAFRAWAIAEGMLAEDKGQRGHPRAAAARSHAVISPSVGSITRDIAR